VDEGSGLCGVWAHRNAVCATYFCKHVRGAAGASLWGELNTLLGAVERNVAAWCVLELDPGADAIARLFPREQARAEPDTVDGDEIDGAADPAKYRPLWGRYWEREAEFFRECGRLAGALSWADALALCDARTRARARLARAAFDRLNDPALPPALKVGSFQVGAQGGETARLLTYRSYDPLEVPNALFRVLPYFDGRPTREAIAAVADAEKIALDDDLVHKLVDFEVLIPASDAPRAR
jgi:hypothetical protein